MRFWHILRIGIKEIRDIVHALELNQFAMRVNEVRALAVGFPMELISVLDAPFANR